MPRRLAGYNPAAHMMMTMSACYLRDDNEVDAERCRISLRGKTPITLLTFDSAGRIVCLTGVVHSIQFDPGRPAGMRWRIEMDAATVASIVR
jgi:hypothetical protein